MCAVPRFARSARLFLVVGAISQELVRWPALIRPATTYVSLMMAVVLGTTALVWAAHFWLLGPVMDHQLSTPASCAELQAALEAVPSRLRITTRLGAEPAPSGWTSCSVRLQQPPRWRAPSQRQTDHQALMAVMHQQGHLQQLRPAAQARDLLVLPYAALWLAMLATAVLAQRVLVDGPPAANPSFWAAQAMVGRWIAGWLGLGWPLLMGIDWLFTGNILQTNSQLPGPAPAWWLPLMFVLIAPAVEEVLFRGVIYRQFLRHDFPYLGMAITSGGFLAFHWPAMAMSDTLGSPSAHLSVLAVSFMCCHAYRQHGLVAALPLHMLHNLAVLTVLWVTSVMP